MNNKLITVHLKADNGYHWTTSINGSPSNKQITQYFKDQIFNIGSSEDQLVTCIDVTIERD